MTPIIGSNDSRGIHGVIRSDTPSPLSASGPSRGIKPYNHTKQLTALGLKHLSSAEAPPLLTTNSPPSSRHAKGYLRGRLGLVREVHQNKERQFLLSGIQAIASGRLTNSPRKTRTGKTQKLDVTYCSSNPE